MKNYKQVIVIRTDTDMRKGKMCGQVAHASVTAAHQSFTEKGEYGKKFDDWYFFSNQTKVVLKVSSEAELEKIAQAAEAAGIVVSRIHDAGHTQLDPHTFTCIGIGPDEESRIDAITGDLKLL